MEISNTTCATWGLKNVKKAHILPYEKVVFSKSNEIREKQANQILVSKNEETLSIRVLPEDLKVSSKQKRSKAGVYWISNISFSIFPQKREITRSLDYFTGQRVIIGLELTDGRVFVYGNELESFRFLFEEINEINLDGYKVTVYGETSSPVQIVSIQNFVVYPSLPLLLPEYL